MLWSPRFQLSLIAFIVSFLYFSLIRIIAWKAFIIYYLASKVYELLGSIILVQTLIAGPSLPQDIILYVQYRGFWSIVISIISLTYQPIKDLSLWKIDILKSMNNLCWWSIFKQSANPFQFLKETFRIWHTNLRAIYLVWHKRVLRLF